MQWVGTAELISAVANAGALGFREFVAAYDALLKRARDGELAPEDFADTTCTLTNPGTIGTVSSLPRLMMGQGFILATGARPMPLPFPGSGECR